MGKFLHVDLDAFFASVEILDHPQWKNLPVIVGGKPEDRRSVVSTASYEARKFGVHSAMPTAVAARLCPEGIFVHPRMERYLELSEKIMEIFAQYSPDVQQISIDEAFIDLSGTERLFGPSELTAQKIKKQVKDETGLTVSVGLASNKYLAKLASEVNKPDGFFEIKEGFEEDFMLHLPLKKVWGIGAKTLAALNSKGITTTKSLYEKSLSLLTSFFGKAGGTFLYNAVRGKETETFNQPAKSHSISAENTYSYDLTDKNAIDTALLHLCHTVVFRMLKEKKRSFTVSIKIRYDDFSTFSLQETSEREISSVDDLFERTKKLFYKKYDNSHGIRLLGVGAGNVEDSSSPRQAELFDFGEEKKRKVEQAILLAKQKNPELKITKARLISTDVQRIIATFFLSSALFFGQFINHLFAEVSTTTEISSDAAGSIVFDTKKLPFLKDTDSASIFDYKIFDKNVEFIATGSWQTILSNTWSMSFGFDSTPAYSIGTPIFTTKTDLEMWFFLDKKWYFEASFADDFEKNTIAAGYYGQNLLKEARVANRGIKFPSIYSVDKLGKGIGGGKNEAPGISLNFADEAWRADFTLRYDRLCAKSKTWYGKNSVSTEEIELSDYVTGFRYILPSKEAVLAVKNVYVESSNGEYKDKRSRRYKKLDSTQYLLSSANYSIFLSKDSKAYKQNGVLPAVAIEYENSYESKADSELGEWGILGSPGSGFLGKTQEVFTKNLSNYSIPLKGEISSNSFDSLNIRYIQYPASFSPYAFCARYDAGLYTNAAAAVAYKTTQKNSNEYSAVLDDDYSFASADFFNTAHSYIDIHAQGEFEVTDPMVRFPLAQKESGAYLALNLESDLEILLKTYTPVSRFDIGTNAVPGTITVYINGIQDINFSFDEENGTLSLSSIPSSSDKVYAMWYEEGSNESDGNLVVGAGIKKDFSDKMSADFSFSSRWAITEDSYTVSSENSPGFVSMATGFSYAGENFSFFNALGASIETANTTGTYKISSMDEEKKQTLYLLKNAAEKLSAYLAPVLNSRPKSTEKINITLAEENKYEILAQNGRHDSQISGYAVPLEWDFTQSQKASEIEPNWAALSLNLPGNSGTLASASSFSIALKTDEILNENTKIYLQLGIKADDNLKTEDSDTVPTWLISAKKDETASEDVLYPFYIDDEDKLGNFQTVTVKLKDEDRAKLAIFYDARIIITDNDNIAKGTLYAGPYTQEGISFATKSSGSDSIYQYQKRISLKNYARCFDFSPPTLTEQTYTISRFYDEFDLDSYEKLCIKLSISKIGTSSEEALSDTSVKIIFDRPDSDGEFKTALSISLSETDVQSLSSYKTLTVDLSNKKASLGTVEKLDKDTLPTRLKILVTTSQSGTLSIDELYLSDAKTYFTVQDKTETSFKYSGTILQAGNYALLKDFELNANATASSSISSTGTNEDYAFSGGTNVGAVFTLIKLYGELARSSQAEQVISCAAHKISTEKPILNILSLSEEYNFDDDEDSLEKLNSATINLSKFNIPLKLSAKTSGSSNPLVLKQNSSAELSFNIKNFNTEFSAGVNQKILPSSKKIDYYQTQNYIEGWKNISDLSFSKGKKDADTRKIEGEASFFFILPVAEIKPLVKTSIEGNYKNSSAALFSDNFLTVASIPFSLKRHSFSLNWEKSCGGVKKIESGGSYKEDSQKVSTSLSEKDWYAKSIPIFDLFDTSLSDNVLKDSSMTEKSTESLYYTSSYKAAWKRPFFGTKEDFFIPVNASMIFERSIQTASSISDQYNLKAVMTYNALNIFGSKGIKPLFRWYETDEYITSFTGTLKIPKNSASNTKMILTFYQQDSFYISNDSNLKAGVEFSFEDKDNLSLKTTAIYKRIGNDSPVAGAIKLFKQNYNKSKSKIIRTDAVNVAYSRANSASSTDDTVTIKTNLAYDHNIDIEVSKFVNVNAGVGLESNCTWNEIVILSATASIGATIKF